MRACRVTVCHGTAPFQRREIMDKLTSGKIAPKTGEYNIVSEKGKVVGTVRVKKGDRMPPTRYSGSHFVFGE